jgi:uncharacterized RmlC-like cupin family protein
MNTTASATLDPHPAQATEVRLIKPLQLDQDTAQTPGMRRLAAISSVLIGSEALWAGVMLAEPGTASSVHHHGPLETVVYVLSGRSKVRWGNRLEHETDMEAGDFVYIPPYMPHQEINPSPDKPTQWIVVRSGGEAVAYNLTRLPNGEYGADTIDNNKHSIKENHHV